MTQEDKQLLFRDLCARLPYGVMLQVNGEGQHKLEIIGDDFSVCFTGDDLFGNIYIEDVKPYLRPMSSMTDEEIEEIANIKREKFIKSVGKWYEFSITNEAFVDWLNAYHFDYRGLIPIGLALEAPKDMYNTKTE